MNECLLTTNQETTFLTKQNDVCMCVCVHTVRVCLHGVWLWIISNYDDGMREAGAGVMWIWLSTGRV